MRLLIQKVSSASVCVAKEPIASIQEGLLVLLGVHQSDTDDLISPLVSKLVHLRIFPDEAGKMNRSLLDVQGEVLVVSQFTLYGNCNSGRRPDFLQSAGRTLAEPLYETFLSRLRELPIKKVASGQFGAHMEVSLVNDGPVTFLLES